MELIILLAMGWFLYRQGLKRGWWEEWDLGVGRRRIRPRYRGEGDDPRPEEVTGDVAGRPRPGLETGRGAGKAHPARTRDRSADGSAGPPLSPMEQLKRDFVEGRIEVEEYEAGLDELLRKGKAE